MNHAKRTVVAGGALLIALLTAHGLHAQPPASPAPAAGSNWQRMAYDELGPEKTKMEQAGSACTIFRPETLGSGGRKNPIVLWGNGTGQMPPVYGVTLKNLASWGFVVAAANTTNAGTGVDMLACLDWLTAENGRADSPYAGKLDLSRVGASGHSQGGGGTLMAGRDPRIKATAPVMPYTRGLGWAAGAQAQQHGPVLMLSGGADTIADPPRNQQPVFDTANTPMIWATLAGAGHLVPMRDGGVYPGIITAWFRYQLMDDAKAAAMFKGPDCGYCKSPDWTLQKKGGG